MTIIRPLLRWEVRAGYIRADSSRFDSRWGSFRRLAVPDRSLRRVGFVLALGLMLVGSGHATAWAQGEAEALSSRFRQASRQALPSVVTVRPQGVPTPFDRGVDPEGRAAREGGSGVVVEAARGLVVTNDHVIAGATRGVVVILANGRERVVSQTWRDPKSDLALLAIDPADLVAAPWGDSDRLDIGDWVLAIGGPFGLSGTVTAGIVSGKGRGIGMALYEDLIQTDAAINPGNSGGPLINLQGQVVGINTALKTNGGGFEGVGFAVPSSRARRVVAELSEFGRVRRAYLGITTRPIDPGTAARLNLNEGVVVSSVVVGSPASVGGLQPGDVILTVGGRPAGGIGTIQGAVEVARIGEPLDLTVDRNGQVFPLQVRPEPQPDQFGLPITTSAVPTETILPVVPGVPIRRRGLRINVPGLDMVVPGPNLDITPFGVSRPPVYAALPPGPVVVPTPAPGPIVTSPAPNPIIESEPELRSIDPTPSLPIVPTQPAPVETSSRSARFPNLGLDLAEPTPAVVERWHLDRAASGLVIQGVDPGSPADRGGLEPGMRLTDAGGKMIGNLDDFRQVVANRPDGRDLLVRIRKGSKAEFRVVVAADQPTAPPTPTLEPLPPAPPNTEPRPL